MGWKSLLFGAVIGVVFSAVYISAMVYNLETTFRPLVGKSFYGVASNEVIKRNLFGMVFSRLNLDTFTLYGFSGLNDVSMTNPHPYDLWVMLHNEYAIESAYGMSIALIINDTHPASTLPPKVVEKQKYGDCDDFAFYIAQMYNESYVVFVFIDGGPEHSGFHAFPVVKYGGKFYAIDYVGEVIVVAESVPDVLKKYKDVVKRAYGCDTFILSLYRVH